VGGCGEEFESAFCIKGEERADVAGELTDSDSACAPPLSFGDSASMGSLRER
jgi:hypothetical protein